MNKEAMFSSKNQSWETPKEIFEELNKDFSFTLDPCCTDKTAKCTKYYTEKEDGLKQDWSKDIVFVNPPYGKDISKWILKCYEESLRGATIVLLIPSRTDTKYQHNIIFEYSKVICFIQGRLKFGNSKNSAPFPSQLVIFSNKNFNFIPRSFLKLGKSFIL